MLHGVQNRASPIWRANLVYQNLKGPAELSTSFQNSTSANAKLDLPYLPIWSDFRVKDWPNWPTATTKTP